MTQEQDNQQNGPLGAAKDLTDAMQRLSGRLAEAVRYSRRSRIMIWVTIVSLVLDVALTVVLALVAVQASNASHTAESARAASTALCQAGNQFRAKDAATWDYLLFLLGPGTTPAAKHAEKLLREKIAANLSPRACPGGSR